MEAGHRRHLCRKTRIKPLRLSLAGGSPQRHPSIHLSQKLLEWARVQARMAKSRSNRSDGAQNVVHWGAHAQQVCSTRLWLLTNRHMYLLGVDRKLPPSEAGCLKYLAGPQRENPCTRLNLKPVAGTSTCSSEREGSLKMSKGSLVGGSEGTTDSGQAKHSGLP